jgi:hypothetical protein
MRPLVLLIGDEIYTPQGTRIGGDRCSETRAVATALDNCEIDPRSMGTVEEIVILLARAARLAQGLNADDARRARDFFEAARSLLHASTRLPADDQGLFEAALRNSARQ